MGVGSLYVLLTAVSLTPRTAFGIQQVLDKYMLDKLKWPAFPPGFRSVSQWSRRSQIPLAGPHLAILREGLRRVIFLIFPN